jgi:hypothetical protein
MSRAKEAFNLSDQVVILRLRVATYLRIAFANGWLCVAATTPPLPTDTIEREVGV